MSSLPIPDMQALPPQPSAAPVAVPKKAARQLPVDSELNDFLAGSDKIRAVRVTIDKRRPRFIAAGSLFSTDSLAKDFDRIALLLEGSQPQGILVYLPDKAMTLPAKDTDWVIIVYVPEGVKKREEMQWAGAGDSFITNYPEKRIVEWKVSRPEEASYFAFCAVAKQVMDL